MAQMIYLCMIEILNQETQCNISKVVSIRLLPLKLIQKQKKKMVVYQSLKDKRVWIRPYEMFISKVDREKYPNADQSYRLIKVKITA